MPYRYQIEFEKISVEKKQTEVAHNQLLTEFDELRERFVSYYLFICYFCGYFSLAKWDKAWQRTKKKTRIGRVLIMFLLLIIVGCHYDGKRGFKKSS